MSVWRCDVTRNPVGTDTVMVGAAPCSCQGCRAAAENERLRAAVSIGLSWMCDLEHMGSVVDQDRLSADIGKVTDTLGWVRVDQQSMKMGPEK